MNDELEREIRISRPYSLEEALGRLAGSGTMKGASPLAGRREAEAVILQCVRDRLSDPAGALVTVLVRRVVGSARLEADPHQPLVALMATLDGLLAQEDQLRDLVREADQEWGRVMGERPYFERPGHGADPDDPYTWASVRRDLSALQAALGSAVRPEG